MKIGNKSALEAAIAVLGEGNVLAEGEFTITDYAEHQGLTYHSASGRLATFYREGKLEKRQVIHNGKRTNAFRLKPTETKKPVRRKPKMDLK